MRDYGCFVKLLDFPRARDGLLHVSEMKWLPGVGALFIGRQRPSAEEMVQRGDSLRVRVFKLQEDKISLTTNLSGEPERVVEVGGKVIEGAHKNPIKPITTLEGAVVGSITGVKLDGGTAAQTSRKMLSPDLWEYSRLKAGQMLTAASSMWKEMQGGQHTTELRFGDDGADIEMKNEPAPFLKDTRVRGVR